MTYEKLLAMVAAAAVIGSGVGLAGPAVAQNGKPVIVKAKPLDAVPTRWVSYRDLNLASAQGEKILNHRVRRAVSQVCDESTGPSPLLAVEQSCRADSWSHARPQMELAVRRAKDIAANGHSMIAPVAIAIIAYK